MSKVIPIEPAHAKLSASGSKKWLACTPSARFEEQFPEEQSEYALEGTFAHAVFEQELLTFLGRPVEDLPEELLRFDSPGLRDHVMEAVRAVIERIKEAYKVTKDPVIMVERRLDFSRWVPEGFGTGDVVIVTDDLVEVMDLKYGKGVVVEAENNSQMRLYGLGAYNELAHLYDIKHVRMTVLQPRLGNYSAEELTIEELLEWADNVVVPAAKLAWDGEGEFVAGEHCTSGFCKARYRCSARAGHALQLAKADFALVEPELMTEDQIVQVLTKGKAVADWISDVQSYALKQAAEHGKEWPGYKIVEGRSNRKYSDADAVAAKLQESGVEEALIYERSLRGITALESLLGKKRFNQLLGDLIVKPAGKPTLVVETDKRLAISSVASAAADFQ
jgi:hypothetical protein